MSSETIPEWAREEAFSLLSEVQMKDVDFTRWDAVASLDHIARALLAAEQRGRKAGIEESYSAVRASRDMDGSTSDDWDQGHACAYGDALAAIRSLGDKT